MVVYESRGSPGASLRLQTWLGRTPTWPLRRGKRHRRAFTIQDRRSPMDEGRFQNEKVNETHVLGTMGGLRLIIYI